MLSRKITQATFDGLNDILKAEYKKNGDGYVLDADDAKELINARDVEKTRADNLKKELDTAKGELVTLRAAGGDFTSLEASYKAKITDLETQLGTVNTTLTGERRDRHIGAAADELAKKHFTVPGLMKDKIAGRLDLDPKDNKTIRVLDKDGKPSASSLADLAKEFVDNPEYKAIVVANRASGSATGPGSASGTQSPANPFIKPVDAEGKARDLSKMSTAELAAHSKASREAKAEAATGTAT